ncbi:hypothetical protein [Methanococcus vannielii]|jgi:hypothetical protein|uniref:hypothetical protein n=1 Tax=Methanococcus vannielii TaxID=2187 RepID=UPI00064F807A|nr:hypothetical protein [Methanococcus vannielii]
MKIDDQEIMAISGNNLNPVKEIPYFPENLLGSTIILNLNDNANDNNYNDGEYIIKFPSDGSAIEMDRTVRPLSWPLS